MFILLAYNIWTILKILVYNLYNITCIHNICIGFTRPHRICTITKNI